MRISKQAIIRTELELEKAVRDRLRDIRVPGLRLIAEPAPSGSADNGVDLWLHAEVDARPTLFAVQCKLEPTIRELQRLKQQAGNAAPLLATVRLPKTLFNQCRELGISCLDINGYLYLRQPGLIVDWEHPEKKFRTPKPNLNLFSDKSSRLSRALLSFPGRKWKQSDLVEFTYCSAGLISRLIREYTSLGWVEGSWGDWTLTQPEALLDAWIAGDNWKKRGTLRQYSSLERDPDRLAKRFLEVITDKIAFTQWFAAAHRHPYTELPIVSAYCRKFPDERLTDELGLREVNNGGRLWLIAPRDEGVFQATQIRDEFPLVCDSQIYIDLLQVGLRGPDAARALREWEGFRK
jgi:hypothetical protein